MVACGRRSFVRSALVLVLVAFLCTPSAGQRVKGTTPIAPAFVEHADSWAGSEFLLLGGPVRVFCEPGRFVLQLVGTEEACEAMHEGSGAPAPIRASRACNIEFQLPSGTQPEGQALQPGVVNILRGTDPSTWRTGLRRYGAVVYRNALPGVDLRLEPSGDGVRLEARSGSSDAYWLDLACAGMDAIVPKDAGLLIRTPAGDVLLAGVEHVTTGTVRIPLRPGWGTIAQTTGPDLTYGSYFGGSDVDEGYGVAVHWPGTGATRTFVCGRTASATIAPSFPAGSFDVTHNGLFDAFVLKLNGAGNQLVYATYIGGDQDDVALDMVVDGSGNAYVTGLTSSIGFPTTSGAFDTTYNGSGDAFALALDSTGASLTFSTFLGGSAEDVGYGIAIDGSGNAFVTGQTSSTDYPLLNPPPKNNKLNGTASGPDSDGFVTKLVAGGASIGYSTYITGDLSDACVDLVVDSSGQAHVVGNTDSLAIAALPPPFSSVPGFDPSGDGGSDSGFLASLSASGSQVLMRTFLEGSGDDTANGVSVDGSGYVYATGYTASSGFPVTSGSYDTSLNGGQDAFLVRVELSSGNLAYGTFLGGSANEIAWDMDLIGTGVVALFGSTASTNFPTTSRAYDTTHNGGLDVFAAKLDVSQSGSAALVGSTFVGGRQDDEGLAVRYDAHEGKVHATGWTKSNAFPTAGLPLDNGYSGGTDAFIIRVTMP